jgi:hypothetical protein
MIENQWNKSTRSNGNGGNNCVQAFWKKSSYSNPSGNCLEAKTEGDLVLVRDTKLGEQSPVFSVPEDDWQVFVAEIKGRVVFPASRWIYTSDPGEGMRLHTAKSSDTLLFTVAEWDAFLDGARAGEFDLQAA